MGEITDAILEGDLCEQCGEDISPGDGYPRSCAGCAGDDDDDDDADAEAAG